MHRADKDPLMSRLLVQFAQFLMRLSKKEEGRTSNALKSIIQFLCQLGGFAALTLAGFHVNSVAGLIMSGLSLFIVAWLVGGDAPNPDTAQ